MTTRIQGLRGQIEEYQNVQSGYQKKGMVIVEQGKNHTIRNVRVITGGGFKKAAAVIKCKLSRKKHLVGKHAIAKNLALYAENVAKSYLAAHKSISKQKDVDNQLIHQLITPLGKGLYSEVKKISDVLKEKDQHLLKPVVDHLRTAVDRTTSLGEAFRMLHNLKNKCDIENPKKIKGGREHGYARVACEFLRLLEGHDDYALSAQVKELKIYENLGNYCLKYGTGHLSSSNNPSKIQWMIENQDKLKKAQEAVGKFSDVKTKNYSTLLAYGVPVFEQVSRLSGRAKAAYPTQVSEMEEKLKDYPSRVIQSIQAIDISLKSLDSVADMQSKFYDLRNVRANLIKDGGKITHESLNPVKDAINAKLSAIEQNLALIQNMLLEEIKEIHETKLVRINEKIKSSENKLAELEQVREAAVETSQKTAEKGDVNKLTRLIFKKWPKDLSEGPKKDAKAIKAILTYIKKAPTGKRKELREELDKVLQKSSFEAIPDGVNIGDYLFSQSSKITLLYTLARNQELAFEKKIHPQKKREGQDHIRVQHSRWGHLANTLNLILDSSELYYLHVGAMADTREYSDQIVNLKHNRQTLEEEQQRVQATLDTVGTYQAQAQEQFVEVDANFIDSALQVKER